MTELISRETFDSFRNSHWPQTFSVMAQQASAEGLGIDELGSFPADESILIIAPKRDRQMLEEMDIIENRLFRRGFITPSMVQDGFRGDPNTYVPRYSEFGKRVIMACENLFTPQEHEEANEAAKPRLAALMAKAEAEFGPF